MRSEETNTFLPHFDNSKQWFRFRDRPMCLHVNTNYLYVCVFINQYAEEIKYA